MGVRWGFLEEKHSPGGVGDLSFCQEDANERIDEALSTSVTYDWNKPFNLKTR